ncbi:MAG: hypothetical protein C4523_05420 [Myxococcales bacterium]|nr:MAG: hypothetical protein C4523_05420 [Myxococcales bacterium]
MRIICLFLLVFLLLGNGSVSAQEAAHPDQEPLAVAVPPIRITSETLKKRRDLDVEALTNIAAKEAQETGGFRAISYEDVRAVLDVREKQDLLGCDSQECLVEIGDLLDTDFLLSLSLGQVGDTYVANGVLMDLRTRQVVRREAEEAPFERLIREVVRLVVCKMVTGPETGPRGTQTDEKICPIPQLTKEEQAALEERRSERDARGRERLAVADVRYTGEGGIDTKALTGLVGSTIESLGRYGTITQNDVAKMLDLKQQQQLVGCESKQCIVEVGAALGAKYMVTCDIGLVEGTHVVTATLINVPDSAVDNRVSVLAADEAQVLEAVRVATLNLFGANKELTPAIEKRDELPTKFYRYGKWGFLAGGVAVTLGVGMGGSLLAVDARDKADSADTPSKVNRNLENIDKYNDMALAGYIIGGALVGTAVVFFVLDAVQTPSGYEEPPPEESENPGQGESGNESTPAVGLGTDGKDWVVQVGWRW